VWLDFAADVAESKKDRGADNGHCYASLIGDVTVTAAGCAPLTSINRIDKIP